MGLAIGLGLGLGLGFMIRITVGVRGMVILGLASYGHSEGGYRA